MTEHERTRLGWRLRALAEKCDDVGNELAMEGEIWTAEADRELTVHAEACWDAARTLRRIAKQVRGDP